MTRTILTTILLLTAAILAGCAHHDLKAPCAADEGALSYAEPDSCGPMRPINGPFSHLNLGPARPLGAP